MATEKVSGLVGRAVEEVGELVARRFRLHRHRPNWRNSHGPLFWSLPYWANILIFVAWFIAALFIIGLIVGFVKGWSSLFPRLPALRKHISTQY
jgi:hypothetical protein